MVRAEAECCLIYITYDNKENTMIERDFALTGMNVSQVVNQLSAAYISLIRIRTPFKRFPSVMLWGPPGAGKSQGIRQVAAEIEAKTGKKAVITDVRLLLFNPVDLRGIPTANADKTLAVWLKPKIFQMDESPEVVNILFLDEISAAPQSVQAAAYQITLDRMVGEHRLPDNCIVVAAGNRVTDRSVAYTMPKALANRLCHIDVVVDHTSWHNWAVAAGIHPVVLGFVDGNPGMLMKFDPESDGLAFPTPRSWEMVSNIMNHISGSVEDVFPIIAGCVGNAAAYELRNWSEVYNRIPDIKSIFDGATNDVPVRPEALYALASRICAYAHGKRSRAEIENAVIYASRLPVEFRNRIYKDLLQIQSIRRTLSGIDIYDDWFARSGRDWEDYGV